MQVDLNFWPKPFYENIVHGAAFAVHTDFNILIFQNFCKFQTRVLSALICVKYAGYPMASQRPFSTFF